jgi:hypothetical protein
MDEVSIGMLLGIGVTLIIFGLVSLVEAFRKHE